MMKRKGILLAGGLGTRLYPATRVISKQLLPVFDKPMIYYPLSTLMLAQIKEILLISTPRDIPNFKALLGDGSQWGIDLHYAVQHSPDGLVQAFIIAESFIENNPSVLILGDNVFYGHDFYQLLNSANKREKGATIFAYHVNTPEHYGVIEFNHQGKVHGLEEKPLYPRSNYVVTGLYFYDSLVVEYAKRIKPSARGELEITDLNRIYLKKDALLCEVMGRGYTWLDTGTHENLVEAHQFVQTIEHRQGLKIACPEEIAFRQGWISASQVEKLAAPMIKNNYGQYLSRLVRELNPFPPSD